MPETRKRGGRKIKHAINVSLVVVLAAVLARPAAAEPVLDLWLTGQLDDTTLTVEVHRANQQFGLGGLHYELQLSEALDLTREYSDFGWVANDGFWDCSNPLDGAAAVSLISATFDTVADPPASEFPSRHLRHCRGSDILRSFHYSRSMDILGYYVSERI